MFYAYWQNNSHGNIIVNDNIDKIVIIEADNQEQADFITEQIGIYFNGVINGIDCPCCGDRWNDPDIYENVEEIICNDYNMRYGNNIIFHTKKHGKWRFSKIQS